MQIGIALTYDQYMNLAAKCSDTSASALDDLNAVDNIKLIQEITDFLENGPRKAKFQRFPILGTNV